MKQTPQAKTKDLMAILGGSSAFERVSAFTENGKLVLEGCVESYALKHRVEQSAREVGFVEIDNCLRVYPCEEEERSQPSSSARPKA